MHFRIALALAAALSVTALAYAQAPSAASSLVAARSLVDLAEGERQPLVVDHATLVDLDHGDAVVLLAGADEAVLGRVDRKRGRRADRFTLSGSLVSPRGDFVLAVNGDAMAGSLHLHETGFFAIRMDPGGGGPQIERTVPPVAPDCETVVPAAPADEIPGGGVAGGCDDGTQIDILIAYTPGAQSAAGGVSAVESIIDMMVEDANIAYVNTGLDLTLNLVYAVRVEDNSSSLNAFEGTSDGVQDEIHAIRDAYGADLVALLHGGGGGQANGLSGLTPGSDAEGFSVNGIFSASAYVLAHEVGHNLGCCHAIGDGGGCGTGLLFPFSNGFRFNGNSGPLWRTVLAYSPGTRVRVFSSPDVLWDGQPTGQFNADNKTTILASKTHVANYRCSDTACSDLDLPSQGFLDCNFNNVPDACEIALGELVDDDLDGIPDACECMVDVNGDEVIDELDCINEFCEGALAVGTGVAPFHTTVASDTDGPSGFCEAAADVWFLYTAPATGNVVMQLENTAFDAVVSAYDSTDCELSASDVITCASTTEGGRIVLPMNAGEQALIRVGGAAPGLFGAGQLDIAAPVLIENDECASASQVAAGVHVFDTTAATDNGPGEGTCSSDGSPSIESDLWFVHNPPGKGPISVDLCGSSFDTKLAVYHVNCAVLPNLAIACATDGGCDGNARVEFTAEAGNYLIRVGGSPGGYGAGVLTISDTQSAANDDCGSSQPITWGSTPFSTLGASNGTAGGTEPCVDPGDGPIDNDIWYRLFDVDGPVTVSVCDADFDTALAVYGSSCPDADGDAIACSDDAASCGGGTSSVTFDAGVGQLYRLRVGGVGGAAGSGTIEIAAAAACPTDITGDGETSVDDLVEIITLWGACPGCAADVNGDGNVDVTDLVEVITFWGPCP